MNTEKELVEKCATKIQEKLSLTQKPEIKMVNRQYEKMVYVESARNHHIKICCFTGANYDLEQPEGTDINFQFTPIQMLDTEYFQLSADRLTGTENYQSFLIELRVRLSESSIISAGYNWLFMGKLKNGESFCAVLFVKVYKHFKNCSLSTLLKHRELKLAKKKKMDFIQTFHRKDIVDFTSAITPSLKQGFALYHGKETGGEQYENKGYVHLRKYLSKKNPNNIVVTLLDGSSYKSTQENQAIIDRLSKFKKDPGKNIFSIQKKGE
jgi:hypothetical protein